MRTTNRNVQKYGSRKQKIPLFPGWLWAGLVMGAVMIVLFVSNTVGAAAAGFSGGISLVCYPVQLLAYLITGIVAGKWEEDRFVKTKRARPMTQPPNYLVAGGLAGLVIAVIAAMVYLVTTTTLVFLMPPAVALFGTAIIVLIGIDVIAAVGLGIIGGLIYSRILA